MSTRLRSLSAFFAKLCSVFNRPCLFVCLFVCGPDLLGPPARSVCVASERLFITYAFTVELLDCVAEWESNRDITTINGENILRMQQSATVD